MNNPAPEPQDTPNQALEPDAQTTHVVPYRPRVAFTPGSITKVVTARRRYVCGNHLSQVEKHSIEPGQRYVRNSLPPNNREIGNDHWWWLRMCLDCCPVEYDERRNSPVSGTDAGGA